MSAPICVQIPNGPLLTMRQERCRIRDCHRCSIRSGGYKFEWIGPWSHYLTIVSTESMSMQRCMINEAIFHGTIQHPIDAEYLALTELSHISTSTANIKIVEYEIREATVGTQTDPVLPLHVDDDELDFYDLNESFDVITVED